MKQLNIKFPPESLACKGCELFLNFFHKHLTTQHCAKQEQHLQLIEDMWDGKQLELDDILQYKHYCAKDITDNPMKWKYAPILVRTNPERVNIATVKIQQFATEHGIPVICWKNQSSNWTGKPQLPEHQ